MFRWLRWVIRGKPMIQYLGFHCGCCGKWCEKPFPIPKYKSTDEWWDTWGLCDECGKGEAE